MKYQVNMFYSLAVEAESEEQAEEKAGEYIASEEGQGVRLSDMSIEVEEIAIQTRREKQVLKSKEKQQNFIPNWLK